MFGCFIFKTVKFLTFSEKSLEMEEISSTSSYETNESTPLLSSGASSNSTTVVIKKKKSGFSLVRPLLKHWLPLLMAVGITT